MLLLQMQMINLRHNQRLRLQQQRRDDAHATHIPHALRTRHRHDRETHMQHVMQIHAIAPANAACTAVHVLWLSYYRSIRALAGTDVWTATARGETSGTASLVNEM